MNNSLLLFLPLLAASVLAQDFTANAPAEESTEPRHAVFGVGIDGDEWSWPERHAIVDGFVLSLGLTIFQTHNGVGLGLGAQWADDALNGVHLSLVQHDASEMSGVQIAGLLNTGGRSEGLQIAGWANFIREGAGVQLSLLWNSNQILIPPRTEASSDYYEWFDANEFAGVQIAPLGNVASCLEGVQIAGLVNRSDGYHTDGLQLALGMNISRRMRGVQAALVANRAEESLSGVQIGLFNYGENVSGLQIGFGNYAHHLEGVQIGLFNLAEDAAVPFLPFLNARF